MCGIAGLVELVCKSTPPSSDLSTISLTQLGMPSLEVTP